MSVGKGAVLGHYEVIDVLGKGGMGEVYLAHDPRLDRRVALKILPADVASDCDRLERFIREAKAASALNHPNIITVYDVGTDSDTPFIAYEYVDGVTLRELAGRGGPSLSATLEIAIQVVSALAEAHQAGIVHRDLKPDNVMVRSSGLVKLLDFGLARLAMPARGSGDDQQGHTQPGLIVGTPRFMSPEQARATDVDHRTDIFSFGVLLYEMLTGVSPFAADTVGDVIAAVLTRDPPRVTTVPPRLADLVGKALQKDRARRHQSATQLLGDLTEVKREMDAAPRAGHAPARNADVPATQIGPAAAGSATTPSHDGRRLRSLAVLPFVSMSADQDDEYFCDGLAEELRNGLARIDDLKVAARTSAFSFKGKSATVAAIAEALGVTCVLEGSIRRAGTRLRISVQLIDAADGYQMWSQRYDRELSDIFALQDDITLAVVDALRLTLFGDKKAAVLERATNSAEAYELFLKGRFHAHKYTAQGWGRAIAFFDQALVIQPDYAQALAGIATARGCLWFFGLLPAEQTIPQARAASREALRLDASLAEAHLAMAITTFFYDWEWQRAEREFTQAIALDPQNAEALSYYALFLAFVGRSAEAIAVARQAVTLDPLAPLINMNAGWTCFALGMVDEASRQAATMIDIDPDFHGAYWLRGAIHLSAGQYESAVQQLQVAVGLGGHPIVMADLASACSLAGQDEQASGLRQTLLALRRDHYVPAVCLARVYSRAGDTARAVDWLETAFAERNGEMVFLPGEIAGASAGDPLGRLADEPRVAALLQRMRLPDGSARD